MKLLFPILILLLAGCDAEDQANANRKLMSSTNTFSIGEAAEARTWTDDLGHTWVVIGKPQSFVVFRHAPGKEWEQVYTNANAPQAIKVKVEQ